MDKQLKRQVMVITIDTAEFSQEHIISHFKGLYDKKDLIYIPECYLYDPEDKEQRRTMTGTVILRTDFDGRQRPPFEMLAEFLTSRYPSIQYTIHEHIMMQSAG